MFDSYGNHVRGGSEVQLNVDGFHILDQRGSKRKVRFYCTFLACLCILLLYGELLLFFSIYLILMNGYECIANLIEKGKP